jgi:hypothetical protein
MTGVFVPCNIFNICFVQHLDLLFIVQNDTRNDKSYHTILCSFCAKQIIISICKIFPKNLRVIAEEIVVLQNMLVLVIFFLTHFSLFFLQMQKSQEIAQQDAFDAKEEVNKTNNFINFKTNAETNGNGFKSLVSNSN